MKYVTALAIGLLLSGCGALRPADVPPPALYRLEAKAPAAVPGQRRTLLVSMPQAMPGFDSARMAYQREPQRVEYYADSQWVDTPARMLAPLVTQAAQANFDVSPSGNAELRLDTQVVQLQQDFRRPPSQLRLTLRVSLVDQKTQRLLSTQLLESSVSASSEDARGGVEAANKAVQAVLDDLSRFLAQAAL